MHKKVLEISLGAILFGLITIIAKRLGPGNMGTIEAFIVGVIQFLLIYAVGVWASRLGKRGTATYQIVGIVFLIFIAVLLILIKFEMI